MSFSAPSVSLVGNLDYYLINTELNNQKLISLLVFGTLVEIYSPSIVGGVESFIWQKHVECLLCARHKS